MSVDAATLGTVPAPHGPGRSRSAAELEAIAREASVRFADATADEVLAWASETFGDALAVACSMAGDTVVPHLAAKHRPGVDVLFLQTGYHFPETIGVRDALPLSAEVTIVEVLPVQSVAEQDATFGARLHDRDASQCCALRKVEPINRELASYEAWVTGLRREDSRCAPTPRSSSGTAPTRWSSSTRSPPGASTTCSTTPSTTASP